MILLHALIIPHRSDDVTNKWNRIF